MRRYCTKSYELEQLQALRATCSPKGACAVCAAKALNQWGGAASPLIQRFRHVRRGVSINTSANHHVDVDIDNFHLMENPKIL